MMVIVSMNQNASRLPPAKLSNSIKKHALQDFRQNTNGNMIFFGKCRNLI